MLAGVMLGCVWLQVAELQRSIEFYQRLGFRVGLLQPPVAILTSSDTNNALILLWERPGTRPRPPRTVGLYHVAFCLPSEDDLAAFLAYALRVGIPLDGASDHWVSAAVYLTDPDGNGIEIYADRPKETWRSAEGKIRMETYPLDVGALLREAQQPWLEMPVGTRVGHVHFRVASLEEAEEFLSDVVGLAVTSRQYLGARFFAADGYHHHVATNTWASSTALPPNDAAGLRLWSIGVGNQVEWYAVGARLRRSQDAIHVGESWLLLRDPWGSLLLIAERSMLPVTPEAVLRMFNQLREVLP
ncbi:MAG: VOC family protein [Candidatus Kapabacteria bacterium]|nr:VOC family protein [Candidatus Kapabacteria bacterium]MDW8226033.1 VOC family protein [Bacteroidota bacterium]